MTSKLNKVLAGFILALTFVFVTSVAMAASNPAKIAGTDVKVRKAPNTSAGIISKLSNSKVTVLDKSNGWYKISFDKKTGWVYGQYVKVITSNGKINANGVNFRQSASTSGKILSSLKKNTNVQILDTMKDWNKVKIGTKIGYVATKFVTLTSTSSTTSSSAKAKTVSSRSLNTMSLAVSDEDDSPGSKVAQYAKKFIGVRYVYGGESPSGFDCSGFIGYVYKYFGIELNRSAAGLYSNGTKVSKTQLQAGDVLFFDASARKASGAIDHAGIYLGNGTFIHASSSNGEVRIQNLAEYRGTYIGAKRVLK